MEDSGRNNPNNLRNTDPLLYEVIMKYQVSKISLARQLYKDEWNDRDGKIKQKLTVRLRNKLNGTGNIEKHEHVQIQNILLEMADAMKEKVSVSIANMKRKEKIEKLMFHFGDIDDKKLDELLRKL